MPTQRTDYLLRYRGDASSIKVESARAAQSVDGLGEATDRAGKQSRRSTTSFRSLAATWTKVAAGAAVLGAVVGKAVRSYLDVERSITKITALVGVNRAEVNSWGDDIKRIGTDFGVGANELYAAMFNITSAGLTGSDALGVLEAAAKASAIGLGDINTIADVATSALNAYGAANITAEEAVDNLTEAIRLGKLEPASLAAAIGPLLPLASDLGVGFDELSGAIAAMSRTGTPAAQAATQLKAVLVGVVQPETIRRFEKIGLSVEDFRKEIAERGLFAALQGLQTELGGSTKAFGQVFTSSEALLATMNLLGSNTADAAQIIGSLTDGIGVLDEAFGETEGTLDLFLRQMGSAAEFAAVKVGTAIAESFFELRSELVQLADAFGLVINTQDEVEAAIVDLTRELGDGAITAEDYTKRMRELSRIYEEVTGEAHANSIGLESIRDEINLINPRIDELNEYWALNLVQGRELEKLSARRQALLAVETEEVNKLGAASVDLFIEAERLRLNELARIKAERELAAATVEVTQATIDAAKAVDELIKKHMPAIAETDRLRQEIELLSAAEVTYADDSEKLTAVIKAKTVAQETLNAVLAEPTVKAAEAAAKAVDKLIEGYQKEQTEIEKIQEDIEALTEAELVYADNAEKLAEIQAAKEEAVNRSNEAIEKQTEATMEAAAAAADWRDSLDDVVDILDVLGVGTDKQRARLRGFIDIFDEGGLLGEGGAISKAGGLLDQLAGASSIGSGLRLLAGGPLAAVGGAASSVGQTFASLTGLGEVSGRFLSNAGGFGEALGFTGKSAIGAGVVGNVVGGIAGGYVGGRVGESLTGKQATQNAGSTLGGIAGSIFGGPLGAFVGSGIGAILDSAFGRKNRRQAVGFFAQEGNIDPRGGYLGDEVESASGLSIRGYARRSQHSDANALANAAGTLDLALTSIARSFGKDVDYRNVTLGGQGFARDFTQGIGGQLPGGGEGFFGLSGNFGLGEGSAEEVTRFFVDEWIGALGDQLSDRVKDLIARTDGTAEELVGAFERILRIDQLLDLDVVRETETALQAIGQETRTLTGVYNDQSDALLRVVGRYDGSIRSLDELSASLSSQKRVAVEYAVALREVGLTIAESLGASIESIRQSQLTSGELEAERRARVDQLVDDLRTAIDPGDIQSIASEINRLANQIFSALGGDERGDEAQTFIDLLGRVEGIANEQVEEGLAALAEREAEISEAADAALAGSQVATDALANSATMIDSATLALLAAATESQGAAAAHLAAANAWQGGIGGLEEALARIAESMQEAADRLSQAGDDLSEAADDQSSSEVNA